MRADVATVERLVRTLRPPLRAKVLAALTYTRTVREPRSPVHHGTEGALWGAALDEAGFGVELEGSWADRPIPLASTLDAEQRCVAEILARTPGPFLTKHALPGAAWARRQWLGIDAPGPLFLPLSAGDVPLYHAIRAAARRGGKAVVSLLAEVPAKERTAVLCDLRLSSLDVWASPAEPMLQAPLPDLGARGRSWAMELADRLLRLFAEDQPAAERGNLGTIPVDLARAAFVSLVRSGAPIEPRWDALLPLEKWVPPNERSACLSALPEARRDAALSSAFGRIAFDATRVEVALELLPELPLASVARVVVRHIRAARSPQRALVALRDASAASPAVAEVVRPLETRLARASRLRVMRTIHPIRRADLDAIRSRQLEAANASYGGKRLTIAEIFAAREGDDDTIMPSLTRLVVLADESGEAAYDVWSYMGDSGSIFEAGTTKRIASIVQGGLECRSLALEIALREALTSALG